MRLIRLILGKLIIALDLVTRSKAITRNLNEQQKLDLITSSYSLYQFNGCPFCVKVRRHMHHKSINIELRDAKNDDHHKKALIEGGGAHKVPCLRIEDKNSEISWLYESKAIISYLNTQIETI